MKKIFFLLAGLPKNIHAVDAYIVKAYTGWRGLYDWLHPDGPPVELVQVQSSTEPVVTEQAAPAPATPTPVTL